MPDPDLSNVSDGPAVFPSDRKIVDKSYVLSEIKRILWFANESDIQKRDENAFTAFTTASVAASGGTLNLHIKNPTSDTSIDIEEISVSTQFRGSYVIHDEFSSAPSGGTAAGIDNLLMDKGGVVDDGNMTVNESVTYTSSGTHYEEQIPSGGSGGGVFGGETTATKPMIEPSREIVIEVTNNSTNQRPASIGVTYQEEPYVYSTQ